MTYPAVAPIEAIARQAGNAIMAIYQRDFDIEAKQDNSPLTEADLAAARAWAEDDPYNKAGLFSDVRIQEWKKVIG